MSNSTTIRSVKVVSRKSELDKFRLYFESDLTTREIREQLKRL